MEGINYAKVIQDVLKRHTVHDAAGETEVQFICDTQQDHYQVVHLGWEGLRRVYGCLVHVDIKEGKIWIQRDGTEMGIANELVAAGVPKQDIVLGFHAPYKRPFTDFAAS